MLWHFLTSIRSHDYKTIIVLLQSQCEYGSSLVLACSILVVALCLVLPLVWSHLCSLCVYYSMLTCACITSASCSHLCSTCSLQLAPFLWNGSWTPLGECDLGSNPSLQIIQALTLCNWHLQILPMTFALNMDMALILYFFSLSV